MTTTSKDIVTAAVVRIQDLDRSVVTSLCSSTCSSGGLTDKDYTSVLRLSNQGVEQKREARAFTKPRPPESWISAAVGWGSENLHHRQTAFRTLLQDAVLGVVIAKLQ